MIQQQTCPICRKKLSYKVSKESEDYPFCSERCRHIDFFRWSDGRYKIIEQLDPDSLDLPEDENLSNEIDDEPFGD